jgi:hypothetical protein
LNRRAFVSSIAEHPALLIAALAERTAAIMCKDLGRRIDMMGIKTEIPKCKTALPACS